MIHYKVTEFNERRLQRSEKYCFRADIYIDSSYDGWVWLSITDITEILKDETCTIQGHEQFQSDILKIKNWNKLWSEL